MHTGRPKILHVIRELEHFKITACLTNLLVGVVKVCRQVDGGNILGAGDQTSVDESELHGVVAVALVNQLLAMVVLLEEHFVLVEAVGQP